MGHNRVGSRTIETQINTSIPLYSYMYNNVSLSTSGVPLRVSIHLTRYLGVSHALARPWIMVRVFNRTSSHCNFPSCILGQMQGKEIHCPKDPSEGSSELLVSRNRQRLRQSSKRRREAVTRDLPAQRPPSRESPSSPSISRLTPTHSSHHQRSRARQPSRHLRLEISSSARSA